MQQKLDKKKKEKENLSEEDKILWELFTKNLNKSSKRTKKTIVLKNRKFENKARKLKKLKLGQGVALSKKNIRNFNKGNVFIEDKLDLHGFNEVEANSLVEDFINKSIENSKRLVLVITGKGKEGDGVIKNNIISWLNAKNLRSKILAVNSASKKHGGSGAIYILLRKF